MKGFSIPCCAVLVFACGFRCSYATASLTGNAANEDHREDRNRMLTSPDKIIVDEDPDEELPSFGRLLGDEDDIMSSGESGKGIRGGEKTARSKAKQLSTIPLEKVTSGRVLKGDKEKKLFPKLKFPKKNECDLKPAKKSYKTFKSTSDAASKCKKSSKEAAKVVAKALEVIKALEKLPKTASKLREAGRNFERVIGNAGRTLNKIPKLKIVVRGLEKSADLVQDVAKKIEEYEPEVKKAKKSIKSAEEFLEKLQTVSESTSEALVVAGKGVALAVNCAAELDCPVNSDAIINDALQPYADAAAIAEASIFEPCDDIFDVKTLKKLNELLTDILALLDLTYFEDIVQKIVGYIETSRMWLVEAMKKVAVGSALEKCCESSKEGSTLGRFIDLIVVFGDSAGDFFNLGFCFIDSPLGDTFGVPIEELLDSLSGSAEDIVKKRTKVLDDVWDIMFKEIKDIFPEVKSVDFPELNLEVPNCGVIPKIGSSAFELEADISINRLPELKVSTGGSFLVDVIEGIKKSCDEADKALREEEGCCEKLCPGGVAPCLNLVTLEETCPEPGQCCPCEGANEACLTTFGNSPDVGRTCRPCPTTFKPSQDGLSCVPKCTLGTRYDPITDQCIAEPGNDPDSCNFGSRCGDGSCSLCCSEDRYCDPVSRVFPRVRGDPHIQTYSGRNFECQAAGEFVMLKSLQSAFELQARFTSVSDSVSASVTTGLVIRDEGYPTLQFSIAQNESVDPSILISPTLCHLNIYIDGDLMSDISSSSPLSLADGRMSLSINPNGSVVLGYTEHKLLLRFTVSKTTSFGCFFSTHGVDYPVRYGGLQPAYRHDEWLYGLNGSPLGVGDFFTRGGDALFPTSLAREDMYKYCIDNFCLEDPAESLFTYEEGYGFEFNRKCDAPYAPFNTDSVSMEVRELCGTDEACLVDGGVGGIEGAENFLRAVIDDVSEGAVLRANATLIPSLEETTVAISYLYQPIFDGNIPIVPPTLDGFALYRLDQPEEQITVLLDVGSGEGEDNVAGDNLFSGVVTLLPEVGQVFGFEVVPIVNGTQDRFSLLSVTEFALIRSFQAELLASPAPSSSPTVSASTLNQVITCISVIDETSQSATTIRNSWISFRAAYPARPFCLLQPKPNQIGELKIPSEFFQDSLAQHVSVNRDRNTTDEASDWFDICNLDELKSQGVNSVVVFIDNSGSLVTADVQASYDLLLRRMSEEGIILVDSNSNSDEEWILPFRADF